MKKTYVNLMERVLSAYSAEEIKSYFEKVKKEGLTEHGFPRLTANIGILLSFGRVEHLKPIFLEMMELCAKAIPNTKAANDFSVREILACIRELEKSGAIGNAEIQRFKGYLSKIIPESTYTVYAASDADTVNNWALFTAVSEFYRQSMGLSHSENFIDTQLATQIKRIDENGMYKDGKLDTHHPFTYDTVSRCLFSLLLNEGYKGRYYKDIDDALRRAGIASLKMQSPNGETAFGGRSNQFLHNEAWLVAVYEYEAKRYLREGNAVLAKKFKSAIKRAISAIEKWLEYTPISHIKNRFPTESMHGCEKYAYFDKYMITTASCLFAAYSICDDDIEAAELSDTEPVSWQTSHNFHKLFLKAGGYGLEFDTDADTHYDASGLGRIHKADAPSAICLSVPCPAEPNYKLSIEPASALSLCPGVIVDGKWRFALGENSKYRILSHRTDQKRAYAELQCDFNGGSSVLSEYKVGEEGVEISLFGNGEIAYMLPAFSFDGKKSTEIKASPAELSVTYNDYVCKYITNGEIVDTGDVCANRNGYYRAFYAKGFERLTVKVEIFKK